LSEGLGTPVDWTSGALVLVLGLVAGLVVAYRVRLARAASRRAPSLEVRDLIEKREVLIHQLRELQDTAGKQSEAQLEKAREALELDAARVWMDLDDKLKAEAPKGKKKIEPLPEPASGFLAERPALRGFLWGIGAMGILGGLLFSVRESATARQQGGTVTGNVPMAGRPATAPQSAPPADAPPQSPEEAELRARVERNPDDLDARLALVQASLGRQDMMGVWNETKAILERSPGNPRALAYQALVRLAMGQGDVARDMLQKLVVSSPDVIEGYLHLALVEVRTGNMPAAEAVMAKAEKRFPARAEMLKSLMAEMKQQPGPPLETAGEGADPHAGLASTSEPAAAAPESAGTGTRSVAGTVDIDPALQGSLAPGAVVFVTAREVGSTGGPPIAVKRLPAAFPLRFQLSSADAMLGGELPDHLKIEARVDSDGDPLTRDPKDPSAKVEGVTLGTQDLHLVLRRSGS
jgi:hypothetical protein